jgi:hypothetical protein
VTSTQSYFFDSDDVLVSYIALEALVAVSIAGNFVQFALCAGGLVRKANFVRKNGNPRALPAVRAVTNELVKQAAALSMKSKAAGATLADEEQVRKAVQW